MSSRIKFIYFDLAGVQYNFRNGITKFINQHGVTYQDFANQVGNIEEKANKGEIPLEELVKMYNTALHLDMKDVSEYLQTWTNLFKPILPVHQLVQKLITIYPIGLLTNIHKELLNKLFDKKLIVDVPYSAIVQSFEINHVKPEKEIFLFAQKKAQVKPEQILFIDDNPEYIKAARLLGWQGVVFNAENMENSLTKITNY